MRDISSNRLVDHIQHHMFQPCHPYAWFFCRSTESLKLYATLKKRYIKLLNNTIQYGD